ncbi:putative Alpha-L-fucosidase 2 precursor [Tripterygium wilfordii]|uniref:Putative Alpha-L-fucosidase 2 n=1 Tax=Tripterygium wilfordii TaxID=458696 RepID=A0A7J7DJI5_TRIWF|nr:putative Alpha-L-fucosidase 2 precursor [Tripterygium wilfordii]
MSSQTTSSTILQEPFGASCGAGAVDYSTSTSTCKQPNHFINWDGVHLTEAMHQVLSDLFFHKPGFCQPPFLKLIKHNNRITGICFPSDFQFSSLGVKNNGYVVAGFLNSKN